MLHTTTQERYEKLRKVFARLMERFNRDDLDDFVQTANSLREWIRPDDTLVPEQKAALQRFLVDQSLDWQICNQLANHQKHARSKPRFRSLGGASASMPVVKGAQVKAGGIGFVIPPSMRVIGAGDEIVIDCDGKHESTLAFVIRTFRHFHHIFEVAPIPPSQRNISSLIELLGG